MLFNILFWGPIAKSAKKRNNHGIKTIKGSKQSYLNFQTSNKFCEQIVQDNGEEVSLYV